MMELRLECLRLAAEILRGQPDFTLTHLLALAAALEKFLVAGADAKVDRD